MNTIFKVAQKDTAENFCYSFMSVYSFYGSYTLYTNRELG
jgi:hypothetical protein